VTEETPEERAARRQRKIEAWCNDLRRMTPDTPPAAKWKTEQICEDAQILAGTDFEGARLLLRDAIEERKQLNSLQKIEV